MGATTFAKYEGLGNDFVLVEASRDDLVSPAEAKALCDRRRGIGADGVVLVLPARGGHDARMRVINSDGSVPEMCGNGLRCAALFVARARSLTRGALTFETDAGPRACEVEASGDEATVTVDMGIVRVEDDVAIDVGDGIVTFTRADAGNPHAVTFARSSRAEAERIGPRVSTHAAFPRGANVGLARVREGALDLVVWERGAGLTLACGTGACAAAAVACAKGLVPYDRAVDVRLPGGTLVVTIARASGRATMRGPARHVFTGSVA
jgi:diaminopimelate epimerase